MDLILRRAQLSGEGPLQDIGSHDGRMTRVAPAFTEPAPAVLDVRGRLVLPAFVNPHFHADKVYFSEWAPEDQGGTVEEGFRKTVPFKQAYTVEDVQERALRVLRSGLANGTVAARLMADVDTYAGLTAVRGLLAARSALQGFATLQVVAFPQEGIFTNPGTETLMHDALALGADVVGASLAMGCACCTLSERSGQTREAGGAPAGQWRDRPQRGSADNHSRRGEYVGPHHFRQLTPPVLRGQSPPAVRSGEGVGHAPGLSGRGHPAVATGRSQTGAAGCLWWPRRSARLQSPD